MIVTLDEMKARLGIVDTSQDDFLTEQLNVVQEAVEKYCRRKFEQASYIQTFYKDEFDLRDMSVRKLMLFVFPVISITTVDEISRASDGTPATDTLTAGQVRIANRTGMIRKTELNGRVSRWFDGCYTETVVTYNAGYSVADMPETIRDVIFNVVTQRYNRSQNGQGLDFGIDVQRISIPGVMSIDYDYTLESNSRANSFGAILGNQLNVLDPWRSEHGMIGDIREAYV